jgi:transposase-like protein
MKDRTNKGHYFTRFNGHKRAKLVGKRFNQFSDLIRLGEKPTRIAKRFGICESTACRIAKKLFEPK